MLYARQVGHNTIQREITKKMTNKHQQSQNTADSSSQAADSSASSADVKALAQVYYERGREFWRIGERGRAISEYNEAAALDPDSPAVTVLRLVNDIMDFYDPNQLNP